MRAYYGVCSAVFIIIAAWCGLHDEDATAPLAIAAFCSLKSDLAGPPKGGA